MRNAYLFAIMAALLLLAGLAASQMQGGSGLPPGGITPPPDKTNLTITTAARTAAQLYPPSKILLFNLALDKGAVSAKSIRVSYGYAPRIISQGDYVLSVQEASGSELYSQKFHSYSYVLSDPPSDCFDWRGMPKAGIMGEERCRVDPPTKVYLDSATLRTPYFENAANALVKDKDGKLLATFDLKCVVRTC
ncbi:MAG: hypothetical protein WC759_01145 [Candidatus Micrarchaeia archaeon]|jgi:hypothetical protein